jgi:uncharacterized membrane protein YeaQ/YmgE (transglycosylase-associated protein family)
LRGGDASRKGRLPSAESRAKAKFTVSGPKETGFPAAWRGILGTFYRRTRVRLADPCVVVRRRRCFSRMAHALLKIGGDPRVLRGAYPLRTGALMNFIIWLVVGGIIGWLASLVMKTDAQQGIGLNIVVGIIGALLGGWIVAPLLGSGTINQNDFSVAGLVASFIGALILLAIVNLFRRGRAR